MKGGVYIRSLARRAPPVCLHPLQLLRHHAKLRTVHDYQYSIVRIYRCRLTLDDLSEQEGEADKPQESFC
jgi:hypothetical protein